MSKYKVEIVKDKKTKNELLQRKTIRLKATNKDSMSWKDVNKFYEKLVKEGFDRHKISISGMAKDKYATLKGFEDSNMGDKYEYDEYFNAVAVDVADTSAQFFFVDFYIKK